MAAGVAAVALAGCGVLPQAPPPLPSTPAVPAAPPLATAPDQSAPDVPTPDASALDDEAAPSLSATAVADGFSAQEHAAVRIRARTCDAFSVGSGFMLDANTVVTNRHVVEGAHTIVLSTYDGAEFEATGSVISDAADLALVTVDDPLEFAAPLADAEPVAGDPLDVVGYPLGGPLNTRTGPFVERVPDTLGVARDDVDLINVSAEHGNSGSGVYDADGNLVGVLYATDENGESFAVTLQSLLTFLADESLQLPNQAECD